MNKKTQDLLRSEIARHFTFEGVDTHELLQILLKHIGDPDPVIRDQLVYPTLAHLLHDQHLDRSVLLEVSKTLVGPKGLFLDLENENENSVLTRSFSMLQLVILVIVHRRDGLYDAPAFASLFDHVTDYLRQETVFDGYDPVKGWIHAIAHSADLLVQLAKTKELGAERAQCILDLAVQIFATTKTVFIHGEDQRMAKALQAVLDRAILDEDALLDWLESWRCLEYPAEYPDILYFKHNLQSLLGSLYFNLADEKSLPRFSQALKETISGIEKRKAHE